MRANWWTRSWVPYILPWCGFGVFLLSMNNADLLQDCAAAEACNDSAAMFGGLIAFFTGIITWAGFIMFGRKIRAVESGE